MIQVKIHIDGGRDQPGQLMRVRHMTEPANSDAVGRGLHIGMAHGFPVRRYLRQGFLRVHGGQTKPLLGEVNAQPSLELERQSANLGSWWVRSNQCQQFRSRHCQTDLVQNAALRVRRLFSFS